MAEEVTAVGQQEARKHIKTLRVRLKRASRLAFSRERNAENLMGDAVGSYIAAPLLLAFGAATYWAGGKISKEIDERMAKSLTDPAIHAKATKTCVDDTRGLGELWDQKAKAYKRGEDVVILKADRDAAVARGRQLCEKNEREWLARKELHLPLDPALMWALFATGTLAGMGSSGMLGFGVRQHVRSTREKKAAESFRMIAERTRAELNTWRAANPKETGQTCAHTPTNNTWTFDDWVKHRGVSRQDPRGSVQVCGTPPGARPV